MGYLQCIVCPDHNVTANVIIKVCRLIKLIIATRKLIRRKLGLFGHICRMHNNRKIKELMFGRMDGTNKRG